MFVIEMGFSLISSSTIALFRINDFFFNIYYVQKARRRLITIVERAFQLLQCLLNFSQNDSLYGHGATDC